MSQVRRKLQSGSYFYLTA